MEQLYIEGLEPTIEDRLEETRILLGRVSIRMAQASQEHRDLITRRNDQWVELMRCHREKS